MNLRTFRANATEINKNPSTVRYVFIVKLRDGRDYVGATTTYRTLKENVSNDLEYVKVVDLRNNTVCSVILESIDDLLDEWRDNYHDPDWSIPVQFFK